MTHSIGHKGIYSGGLVTGEIDVRHCSASSSWDLYAPFEERRICKPGDVLAESKYSVRNGSGYDNNSQYMISLFGISSGDEKTLGPEGGMQWNAPRKSIHLLIHERYAERNTRSHDGPWTNTYIVTLDARQTHHNLSPAPGQGTLEIIIENLSQSEAQLRVRRKN
jgi:hypothetical protein